MRTDGQKRILVVDDNPDTYEQTAKALQAECVRAVIASVSSLDDWQRARVETPAPSLFLMDYHFWDRTAVELLDELKHHSPLIRVPVIVWSGPDTTDEDLLNCYQAGAAAVMAKPEDYDKLSEQLRALCNYWLSVAKLPVF